MALDRNDSPTPQALAALVVETACKLEVPPPTAWDDPRHYELGRLHGLLSQLLAWDRLRPLADSETTVAEIMLAGLRWGLSPAQFSSIVQQLKLLPTSTVFRTAFLRALFAGPRPDSTDGLVATLRALRRDGAGLDADWLVTDVARLHAHHRLMTEAAELVRPRREGADG